MPTIEWPDFEKIDIRAGTIIEVSDFPKAKKPAWQLSIDFGELGVKKSSAQIVKHYSKDELIGKLIIGVVNFPVKQIGPFMSECLTLGVPDENSDVVLLSPTKNAKIGGRMF